MDGSLIYANIGEEIMIDFQFVFKNMSSSAAVEGHTTKKIQDSIMRYVTKPKQVHVTFSVDRHLHKVHIILNAGDGFRTDVHGETTDMYASIDEAAQKLEKQMRKHKEKLKDHKRGQPLRELSAVNTTSGYDNVAIDAEDILKYETRKKRA